MHCVYCRSGILDICSSRPFVAGSFVSYRFVFGSVGSPEPTPGTDLLPMCIFVDDDIAITGPMVHLCSFRAFLLLCRLSSFVQLLFPTDHELAFMCFSYLRATSSSGYNFNKPSLSTMAAPNNVTVWIDKKECRPPYPHDEGPSQRLQPSHG